MFRTKPKTPLLHLQTTVADTDRWENQRENDTDRYENGLPVCAAS
jgi:hypothetical protein